MLGVLRAKVATALAQTATVLLATSGPAGLQVSVCPSHSQDVRLFILIPDTSEHLVNLEQDTQVVVTTCAWQMRGHSRILASPPPTLFKDSVWRRVIEVSPARFEFTQADGLGAYETIDFD
ncbi:MAG: pyridoxamine 5'-phosphate oxidase family protein [Chloroflexi bacterium]|nr:pyridoxamine 5'-phosphate oxidase family protein [Chloroflexota bacterium]